MNTNKTHTFASLSRKSTNDDSLAQQVEHNTFNVGVLGSSPRRITKRSSHELLFFGSKLKGINDNTQSFNAFESRVRNLLTTTESDSKRLKATKCATKIEVVAHKMYQKCTTNRTKMYHKSRFIVKKS